MRRDGCGHCRVAEAAGVGAMDRLGGRYLLLRRLDWDGVGGVFGRAAGAAQELENFYKSDGKIVLTIGGFRRNLYGNWR